MYRLLPSKVASANQGNLSLFGQGRTLLLEHAAPLLLPLHRVRFEDLNWPKSCIHSPAVIILLFNPSHLLNALLHLVYCASSPCVPSKFFYIVLKSRIPVNLAAGHLEVVGSNPFRAIDSENARGFLVLATVPSHCSDPSSWIRGFSLFNERKWIYSG